MGCESLRETTCVATVNWNRREDTLQCLASVIGAPEVGYVVVVDNGSDDHSVEAVRERFPGVTVIQAGANVGYAVASNVAVDHFLTQTSCEFLLLVNNDLVLAPDAIRHLVRVGASSDSIGVCVPKIYYTTPSDKLWYAGGYVNWWKGSSEHRGKGEREAGKFNEPCDVSFACGAAILLERAVIEDVGLFDDRYYMFEEDVEFSLRLAATGHRIRYVPSAVAWHRVGASAEMRGDAFVWYYLVRNRLYTMRRHAAAHRWLRFLAYFPLLCIWKAGFYAWHGNPWVSLAIGRGVVDYLRGRSGEAALPRRMKR